MDRVPCEPPGCGVVKGDAGFVTRSLDPEDQHADDFDTIQPPSRPQAKTAG